MISSMEKAASISSQKISNPGLDYHNLRAYGIQAIQELTGAFWTDYNEHDPGVTILEQLCYAITDLCYRTDFDIQDHLFNHPKDDTFLKAHQILPCNPLTVNDYRKLIFDSVFELKNVWLHPMQDSDSTFKGLYKILIDIDENIQNEQERQAVVEKTRRVFCNSRTICEDVEEVSILKHLNVEVFAEVEVDGVRDTETILAEVFYYVDEYLSPEIRFYSLQELLQEGYKLNEIFNGPLLKHGFIKTSELQPKPRQILISEVIKIIMQVKGVVSVKNLFLKVGDKQYENQIEIAADELPKLVPTLKRDHKASSGVHFFRGSVNYTSLDFDLVKRQLNELKSGNKRMYRLSEETIKVPLGKQFDVENYYSIQNQFPLVYGIGPYGLPESEGIKRQAQAKQLKGFLLIFEQILANYLAQLSNVKVLFSLKEDVRQTYFYQFLHTVPDVAPLLKDKKYEFAPDSDDFSSLSYNSGLPQLVKTKDNYTDRRNRFLDYLLAIHGESYTQYSLSQFNYYFNEEEFERHLILNKTRLLKSLSTINMNRARAFNYLEPSLETENITGMEAKISILLGLGVQHSEEVSNYKAHSLLKHYEQEGLTLLTDVSGEEELTKWTEQGRLPEGLTAEIIEDTFDYIDEDEVELNLLTEEEKEDLINQTLLFRSGTLKVDFLMNGIELMNYRIGTIRRNEQEEQIDASSSGENSEEAETNIQSEEKNKEEVTETAEEVFGLVFKSNVEEEWLLLGTYPEEEQAIAAALLVIAKVKSWNIRSEGLHILEHILLRPDLHDKNHGILLYNQDRKPYLRSLKQYSFEERKVALEEIKQHLYEFSNYSVEATSDKDFEVHFTTPDGKYEFVAMEAQASVDETHERMETLYNFLSDKEMITSFQSKVGLYIRNTHSGAIMPEEFFSYRVSVLLPDWTARFSNKEFRSIIEDTIHEQKPANVALNCYWVNSVQLGDFERVYYQWMEEKRHPAPDKEKLDSLENELSNMLFKFKESCEV